MPFLCFKKKNMNKPPPSRIETATVEWPGWNVNLQPLYVCERLLELPAHCSAHWIVVEQAGAVLLDLRLWLKRCMPGYLKDTRRRETPWGTSYGQLRFVPRHFRRIMQAVGMSYLPDVSLGVLAMEKSADICAVLSLVSAGRVKPGSANSAVSSQQSRISFIFCFSPPGTDVSVLQIMEGRLPESFRPGPVRYNVTMEEEIFPRGSIYTQRDVTSISCARGCWEIECFDGLFVHLGQEQPWKRWLNRVVTIQRYIFKGNYFNCIQMKEASTSQSYLR